MFELNTKTLMIILFIVGFVTIIFVTYYFSDKRRVIRILKNLKSGNISNLRQNEFVKITGKAINIHEPLSVSMSNRKCVYYKMKIEQEVDSNDSKRWDTLIEEEEIQDFFLEKNGEKIIIKLSKNPKNYLSHFVVDNEVNSGTFNDASPKFEKLLKGYDIKSTGFLGFNKTLRYTERIIEVGEEITVAGYVEWEQLNEPIADYSYSKIAALKSSEKQKIIITDLPREKLNKR